MNDSDTFAADPAPQLQQRHLRPRFRFVLVETSLPANIGAAARALKTMGFSALHLVSPRKGDPAGDPDAVALATHGADILAAARIHATLAEALDGCTLAFAMTGYARKFGAPMVDLRSAADLARTELSANAGGDVAFVFGGERSGLTNEQVEHCQRCCAIPADPVHGSLNLAQAVMVTAYEARMALTGGAIDAALDPFDAEAAADVARLEGLYAHLERALVAAGFLDPQEPKKLMPRLRRLFARARPTAQEVDILRGICAALEEPKRERIGSKNIRKRAAPEQH